MARARDDDTLAQDHDSFLDIVANIVGILIILVMVVTVRAKDAPLLSIEASPEDEIDVYTPRAAARALESDLLRLASETHDMTLTLGSREQERLAMANMVTVTEKELADERARLDEQQRTSFDLQQKIEDARSQLDQLTLAQIHAAGEETPVVEIESLPTPISKTVLGKELHFQLRGGRLAYIPLDDLVDEAVGQARQKTWNLQYELTEVVGPRDGFRLRYTLEKLELPLALRLETGRTGYIIRAKRWELIPIDSQLGETVDAALAANSRLRQALNGLDRRNDTVTIWTYPDSFDDFRRLKKSLYELGIAVAARPLPAGVPIAGSPSGSRSSAQ